MKHAVILILLLAVLSCKVDDTRCRSCYNELYDTSKVLIVADTAIYCDLTDEQARTKSRDFYPIQSVDTTTYRAILTGYGRDYCD